MSTAIRSTFLVNLIAKPSFRGESFRSSPPVLIYEGDMKSTLDLEGVPEFSTYHRYRLFLGLKSKEPTRLTFFINEENNSEKFVLKFDRNGNPETCAYIKKIRVRDEDIEIKIRAKVKESNSNFLAGFYPGDHELYIPSDSFNKGRWMPVDKIYEEAADPEKMSIRDEEGRSYLRQISMAMIAFLEEAIKTTELAQASIV